MEEQMARTLHFPIQNLCILKIPYKVILHLVENEQLTKEESKVKATNAKEKVKLCLCTP
jgi:hypothetical protein